MRREIESSGGPYRIDLQLLAHMYNKGSDRYDRRVWHRFHFELLPLGLPCHVDCHVDRVGRRQAPADVEVALVVVLRHGPRAG